MSLFKKCRRAPSVNSENCGCRTTAENEKEWKGFPNLWTASAEEGERISNLRRWSDHREHLWEQKPRFTRHGDSSIPQSHGIPSRQPPHRMRWHWRPQSPYALPVLQNFIHWLDPRTQSIRYCSQRTSGPSMYSW